MKIPSTELHINKHSYNYSDKYDSDITIVSDSQEKKHKKKHKHLNVNSEGSSQNHLWVEASQSLLQPKKKKKLSVTKSDSLDVGFSNGQSQSMSSRINGHTSFTDVFLTDDSEICSESFKKLKKKKKRRATVSEDLFTDDAIPSKKKGKIPLIYLPKTFLNSQVLKILCFLHQKK